MAGGGGGVRTNYPHIKATTHLTELCCKILHCTGMYCFKLYCTVLYFTVLYCILLYCILLDCTKCNRSNYNVLYRTNIYSTKLHCTMYSLMQCSKHTVSTCNALILANSAYFIRAAKEFQGPGSFSGDTAPKGRQFF